MSYSPRYIARMIDAYRKAGLLHTFIACDYKPKRMLNYMFGKHAPHYPMPAIPTRVEYGVTTTHRIQSIAVMTRDVDFTIKGKSMGHAWRYAVAWDCEDDLKRVLAQSD